MKKDFPYLPFILSVTFLGLGIFVFHFYLSEQDNHFQNTKNNIVQNTREPQAKKTPNADDHSHTGAFRSIASVPVPRKQSLYKDRYVIGEVPLDTEMKFRNSPNKNWQQVYKRNIERMLNTKNANVKVTKKKSYIKFDNNTGRYLEHVLVQMTKPNGSPYSYEALIDSETGSMVRSWNKTRYEFKEKLKLNHQNKGIKVDVEGI